MANYASLKTAIQQVVKTNGNNEITGALLQQSLLAMIDSLGNGFQFIGIANISTNPGTPDQNVFYLAGPGTYSNFGPATVPSGHIGALKYNGSWSVETVAVGKDYDEQINQIMALIAIGDKAKIGLSNVGGILYDTGARGGSSNFTNYYIQNNGYAKVRCRVHARTSDTNSAAIAFYSQSTISASAYISGVKMIPDAQYHWYEADVPSGTVMIAICNRTELGADYDLFLYNPLTKLANGVDSVMSLGASINEKSGATTFPIMLKNCTLTESLNASGQYTGGYNMGSHFIRVVGGKTVNFAYTPFSVDGVTTTPTVRIAFYSEKRMSSFISVYKAAYDTPASVYVPANAKYMKVAVSLGVNKYCWQYYVDGAVTISFTDGYPYDFHELFSEYNNSFGAEWAKIQKSNLRKGHFPGAGVISKSSVRSTTREMLFIRPGIDQIKMIRPDSENIYLYQLTWFDENKTLIGQSNLDNFEALDVVSGARFAYITIQKVNGNFYGEYIPDDLAIYFNMAIGGIDDDDISIVEENNKIETIVKLAQAKQPAKVNGTPQKTPLVMLYFSDVHGDSNNIKRLLHFHEYYNNIRESGIYIDAILSGGDNVQAYLTDGTFNWGSIAGAEQILNTVGNHDAAADSSLSVLAAQKDVYDLEFAPFISNWGVTQPNNAAQNGLMYYYKDFATFGIRLVVLDCIFWDAAQLSWFESVLAGAKTAGYSVIAVSHYPIGDTNVIDCNFNSLDFVPDGGARLTTPINAVNDFINGGGNFICWLSGHTHSDGFGTVVNNSDQLNLIIDTARSGSSAPQDASGLIGTRAQDCFNILGFDVYSKLIKVVRIGRDYDRHLRHIGEMCVDYSTKQVLYTR